MKALISFLTFLTCSLCCYSQTSVMGAQQMVAADGSPIKYGKGNSSVLIAGSVGFGPFVSIRVYNKRAYNYIKSELRNKFHFKTAEVDGKWATLKKGNVIVDVSVDGNAYCFTFYIK